MITLMQTGTIQSSLEFTSALKANRTATMSYDLNISGTVSSNLIQVPTLSQFKTQCPDVVLNPVTVYDNYWDVYLCGFYGSAADLKSIRQVLIGVWTAKYPEIRPQLNVDIFEDKIAHTSSNAATITRLQYLVYASAYNLLIEKGKVLEPNKFPSDSEINAALELNGYKSCRGSIIKPIAFSVTLCGTVKKDDYPIIAYDLSLAWMTELATGGNVVIYIQGQQEFLSDDA